MRLRWRTLIALLTPENNTLWCQVFFACSSMTCLVISQLLNVQAQFIPSFSFSNKSLTSTRKKVFFRTLKWENQVIGSFRKLTLVNTACPVPAKRCFCRKRGPVPAQQGMSRSGKAIFPMTKRSWTHSVFRYFDGYFTKLASHLLYGFSSPGSSGSIINLVTIHSVLEKHTGH